MRLPVVVKGALIGGGVGAALALARTPAAGEQDDRARRVAKSAAEGAVAGGIVGFVLDRQLRRRAAALLASTPVALDTVAELAQRYEPAVEQLVELALERVQDAYQAARPIVTEAYEAARPRVEEAVGQVRARALERRAS